MPDFRGATGRTDEMDSAIRQAIQAAQKVCAAIIELGRAVPTPLDLPSVKSNHLWTSVYGIDWSRAVVHTVPVNELIAPEARTVMCARNLTRSSRLYAPR
jgi:hypothetical protein